MNKMITKMLVASLLSMTQFAYGQDCGESSGGQAEFDSADIGYLNNYNDYLNTGSVSAQLVDSEGNDLAQEGDYLLAFDPDGTLIGLIEETIVPPQLGNGFSFGIMIYSHETDGPEVSFKLYSAADGMTVDLNETVQFASDMTIGNVVNPFQVTPTCWPIGEPVAEDCGESSGGQAEFDSADIGYLNNYNDYLNTGSVSAQLVDSEGNDLAQEGDYLLAFDPDGTLIGLIEETIVPPQLGNGFSFGIMIYSHETDGPEVSFKLYSAADGMTVDLNETVQFASDMTIGNVVNPFQVTPTCWPIGDGSDPVAGCTNAEACNYDPSATEDDGSCTFIDDGACDCDGTLPEENYDCEGICTADIDCAGECAGSAVEDECGVCNGDGIAEGACDCAGNVNDCAGVCGGSSVLDGCDECDDDPSNDCVQDCNNEWGGSAFNDNCGICVDSEEDACDEDCNGEFGGSAYEDGCGICDSDPSNDNDDDLGCGCFEPAPSGCDEECGSTLENDECGVCGGSGYADNCDVCDDDASNDCVQDCSGTWGGTATQDACGECDSDPDNDCLTDCAGVPGGDASEDACGVCDSNSSNDNESCTGCMEDGASNYDEWASIPGDCIYTSFDLPNQSQLQAGYFFTDVTINGAPAEIGVDEIYAFKGNVCVGGRTWEGPNYELVVMGDEQNEWGFTDGYLLAGDIPTFKIVDKDGDGTVIGTYDAVFNNTQGAFGDCSGYPGDVLDSDGTLCETFPSFSNFAIYWNLGTADAVPDCDETVGGHSYIDDCADCSGGSTGLGHNHNDPDNDTVCDEGAANGEQDNCPSTENTDQWNYDGDSYGDLCDDDDDNDNALDDADTEDNNELICSDDDSDTCDDCSSGQYSTGAIGNDVAGEYTSTNNDTLGGGDGWDYDGDGLCDDGDGDDDNDEADDDVDTEDNDPFICSTDDADNCDDCSSGTYNLADDGWDYDEDTLCDDGDPDDDNDGSEDAADTDDNNEYICSDDDSDTCNDCSSGEYDVENDGADNDLGWTNNGADDTLCNDGDTDDDNDGALDTADSNTFNPTVCSDDDTDNCDDCSSGLYSTGAIGDDVAGEYTSTNNDTPGGGDGWDYDGDGQCDLGDGDDDNDEAADDVDGDDNAEYTCNDDDGDTCDECSSGTYDSTADGWDYDGDTICDDGDDDDDNDNALDDADTEDNNELICSDDDTDGCDDCSSGLYSTGAIGDDVAGEYTSTNNDTPGGGDGWDYDGDGQCDLGDGDDDNDEAADDVDGDDNAEYTCNDDDGDTCDECSSGTYDSTADGWDYDGDTICDDGDDDDDNDNALDDADTEDNNELICSDDDTDGCDDCSSGLYSTGAIGDDVAGEYTSTNNDTPGAGDGWDYDGDGQCDLGDGDDDNDEAADDVDEADNDEFTCNDDDGDLCDECSSGTFDSENDGWDYDGDTVCDDGDDDDDNDNALDDADTEDNNELICSDDDDDGCDDCSSGLYSTGAIGLDEAGSYTSTNNDTPGGGDGWDYDGDGQCDLGDGDDDNDEADDDVDTEDNDPFICSDDDTDTCDDCSSGSYSTGAIGDDVAGEYTSTDNDTPGAGDGWDYDGDGQCDLGDGDDDNDEADDDVDTEDNDPFICSTDDADNCDDCSSGTYNLADDGWDYDEDTLCDDGDPDDDNDNAPDDVDTHDNDPFLCSDNDGDSCEDCSSGEYNLDADGDDYDSDQACDLTDADDDNDGLDDGPDDCEQGLNPNVFISNASTDHDLDGCEDDSDEDLDDDNDSQLDGDDDCQTGDLDWTSDENTDYDDDGCQDDSDEDPDDDNDGIVDDLESCHYGNLGWTSTPSDGDDDIGTDHDQDGCQDDSDEDLDDDGDDLADDSDDCDPDDGQASDTGWTSTSESDYDTDGCQDITDEDGDDDNDGVLDGPDDCELGELGWLSNETTDYDGDGCLDSSSEDTDDDNDGAEDDNDSNDNNIYECSDNDDDGCEDCSGGSYDTDADGDDGDGDGQCDIGDVDLALNSFANLISFFALPETGDHSVENIFGPLGANALKIFGESSVALHLPDGSWVGSLDNVSDDDGYWLIVEAADILQVQGLPTSPVVYSANQGNNLFSYPFSYAQGIADALDGTGADGNVLAIYGEGGMSALVDGEWFGSVSGFEGGSGYWFVASDAFQFEYNAPGGNLLRMAQTLPEVPEELSYSQSVHQYFYMITDASVGGYELNAGDWIVAYNDDIVVGARQYQSGQIIDLPIMGQFNDTDLRDVNNVTLGYCEPGDVPTVKVHRTNGEIIEMVITSNDDSSIEYQPIGHTFVTMSDIVLPNTVSLHDAYPNPFNPSTTISFNVPGDMNVNLSIYDLRGRLVAELVNGFHEARGISDPYKAVWNADLQSSGIYFVRLTAGSTVQNQKIMLIK